MLNLFLMGMWLFVAIITYFTKRNNVENVWYVVLPYVLGAICFFGLYLYDRTKEKYRNKAENKK